jgi:glyceraldehyde-3-phosphate dehydrogenase/erythrose-4-phosphate dehydrogenase
MNDKPETIRMGINGFGRIGRTVFRQLLDKPEFRVVGINDLANLDDLAYLLKHDSVHGWYPRKVVAQDGAIRVDRQNIPFFSSPDPKKIPWQETGADIIIECSGALRSRSKAAGHLEAFGVAFIMFTTIHAYTSSQSLMDTPARHRRRGRAAALSIIPTTTGAAKAAEKVLPHLKGKMTGMAIRVPVPNRITNRHDGFSGKRCDRRTGQRGSARSIEETPVAEYSAGDRRSAGLPGYHRRPPFLNRRYPEHNDSEQQDRQNPCLVRQ